MQLLQRRPGVSLLLAVLRRCPSVLDRLSLAVGRNVSPGGQGDDDAKNGDDDGGCDGDGDGGCDGDGDIRAGNEEKRTLTRCQAAGIRRNSTVVEAFIVFSTTTAPAPSTAMK